MSQYRIEVVIPHTDAVDDTVHVQDVQTALGVVDRDDTPDHISLKFYYDDALKCLRAVQRLNAFNFKFYVSEFTNSYYTNFRATDDITPTNAR